MFILKFIAWICKLAITLIVILVLCIPILVITKPGEEDLLKGAGKDLIGTEIGGKQVVKGTLQKAHISLE